MGFTPRQAEIGGYIARGMPDKAIAQKTGLSIATVRAHVQAAAAKVPGESSPRHRLTLFFLQLEDAEDGKVEDRPGADG